MRLRKFIAVYIATSFAAFALTCAQAELVKAQDMLLGVSRTGVATPLTPPTTNVVFWGRGDSLTCTPSCTGTNAVTDWVDKSSAMNNASNGGSHTGAYSATALNGKPGVTFDGSATYFTFASAITTMKTTSTICAVYKNAGGAEGVLIGSPITGLQYYSGANGKQQTVVDVNTAVMGDSDTAVSTSNFVSNCFTFSGSSLAFYQNGSADGTTSVSILFANNITVMGKDVENTRYFLNGTLVDIILATSVWSAGDLNSWFAYTSQRYGV